MKEIIVEGYIFEVNDCVVYNIAETKVIKITIPTGTDSLMFNFFKDVQDQETTKYMVGFDMRIFSIVLDDVAYMSTFLNYDEGCDTIAIIDFRVVQIINNNQIRRIGE
jgi:hypothetical protein